MRYLIKRIRQVDGGSRELYAASEREADEAREEIRCDPAMVESVSVSEIVDIDRHGNRTTIR